MNKAKYEDVIYVKHLLYQHYGNYIHENTVIHYDGKIDDPLLRKMCIRETEIERFLAGKNNYCILNCRSNYSPNEIVQRARDKID